MSMALINRRGESMYIPLKALSPGKSAKTVRGQQRRMYDESMLCAGSGNRENREVAAVNA